MEPKNYTAIVFDVGRVLIDFSYENFFAWLVKQGALLNGVADFVEKTDLLAYEHGHISDAAFLDNLNRLLNQPLDNDTLVTKWLDLFTPIEEMLQLTRQLKDNYGVYLLSNTSALHWQHIVPRFQLDQLSHGLLASYKIGAMKPDPAIFHAAERKFALEAKTTVFIDDIVENVEGARRCGWQGIHHKNSHNTRRQLQKLGVILE